MATTLRFESSAPDLSAGGWSKEAEAVESTSNDTVGSTSNGIANGKRSHRDDAEGGDHGLARLTEDQAAAPGRPGRGSQSRAARSARRCARSRGAGAGGRTPTRPLGLSTAFPQKAARHRKTARATLRKDKRVNIRMSEHDLVRLQKTAALEGLPYQTLISSILHKYINGRLIEKPR